MASDQPVADAAARPRAGRLLGDVLVGLGYCDRDTVETVVAEAQAAGRPMGQLLREQGLIDADRLAIALAERFGLQYASVDTIVPDLAAMHLIAPAALRRLEVVPLAFGNDETLLVAMDKPSDVLALDSLARLTDLRVEPIVVSTEDLRVLLARLGGHELVRENPAGPHEEPAAPATYAGLLRAIIGRALDQGASDIHFDPDAGDLQVRFRVVGFMVDDVRIPSCDADGIIRRIKTLSDLDVAERRMPQNGRVNLTVDDRRIDVRVTTVPVVDGESAVLRLLDPRRVPPSLAATGMGAADRARLERALARSHGMILATGPTGSGKATLLYAAAAVVNSPSNTVVTVEDRIRYQLPGVQQVQVVEHEGLTVKAGLRAVLQADPDVVMIGDLRDRENAVVATEAALTDHLVLSTLQTNDAPSVAARLVDIGVEPHLVAAALNCVVAQRLTRRLCAHCRVPVAVPASVLGDEHGGDAEVFDAGGCEHCRQTGYHGRVGLFEVMTVSEEIRALIGARAPAAEIRRTAVAQGMRTLVQDGLDKVRAGETTLAEVARVTA